MAESFQFDLVSPERLLVSESVTAVIAPGAEGYMTVMARHAPLMTTLKPGVVVATTTSGADRRFYVRGGFADVTGDRLVLLAEQAIPAEDLDAATLDTQIRDAEQDAADARTPEAKVKAEHMVAMLRDARAAVGF